MELNEAKKYSDADLAAMKPSKLLRVVIPHAMAYDQWVCEAPTEYKWDMWLWWVQQKPTCAACVAGSVLAVRGVEEVDDRNLEWRERVDNLRCGNVWDTLSHEQMLEYGEGRLRPVAEFYRRECPARSAARGNAWNSKEDPAFFEGYAAALEAVGL